MLPHGIKIVMLQSEPIIELQDQTKYLQELKQIVFDEVIERIEKSLDMSAVDILDTARTKLKNMRSTALITLVALKPICLLFLFEVHLATQVNI